MQFLVVTDNLAIVGRGHREDVTTLDPLGWTQARRGF